MPKKPPREDTTTFFFAAKLYISVLIAFIVAIGIDIHHAAEAVKGVYGG